jgi:hypothetical protein
MPHRVQVQAQATNNLNKITLCSTLLNFLLSCKEMKKAQGGERGDTG